jgi:DNA polymerase I
MTRCCSALRLKRIEADVALLQELMRRASRIVLDPHELRTDATIVRYPDRYVDGRGVEIWDNVLRLLAEHRLHSADTEVRV